MSKLPDLGKVSYYRAYGNIPGAVQDSAMFALVNVAQNKYMFVSKGNSKNLNAAQAQELANMARFIKQEMAENKTRKPGILEQVLFEAESAIASSETDPVVTPDVSLDQKVDRYLVSYEKEAIPTSDDYSVDGAVQAKINTAQRPMGSATGGPMESKKPKKGLLEQILFEAPGDPGEEDPLAAGGDPAAAPPPPGGDPAAAGMDPAAAGMDPAAAGGAAPPAAPAAPPVVDTPKMNMNNYCQAVARLIENYEALLNPKITIFNRAKEYIRVNYDEATASMFEQVMGSQYNITATPDQRDQRDAPAAVGAIYGSPGGA